MNEKTKELGSTFKKRGFAFVEEHRSKNGELRIYQQINGSRVAGIVLARIKKTKPPESWGSDFDLHETFPSAEQFGKTAWQYCPGNWDGAYDRYNQQLARIAERANPAVLEPLSDEAREALSK